MKTYLSMAMEWLLCEQIRKQLIRIWIIFVQQLLLMVVLRTKKMESKVEMANRTLDLKKKSSGCYS